MLTLPPLSGGTAPPIFLQQASHLTDGVYWRWNGRGGLLQYLHVSRPHRCACSALTDRAFTFLRLRSARDLSPSRRKMPSTSAPSASATITSLTSASSVPSALAVSGQRRARWISADCSLLRAKDVVPYVQVSLVIPDDVAY